MAFDRYAKIHELMKDVLDGRNGWSADRIMVELDLVLLQVASEEIDSLLENAQDKERSIYREIRL